MNTQVRRNYARPKSGLVSGFVGLMALPSCLGGLLGEPRSFFLGNALPAVLTADLAAASSERNGGRVFPIIGLLWLYILADGDLVELYAPID